MNLDLYHNLYNYLESDQLSDSLSQKQIRQIQHCARHYITNNELLYKKNRRDPQFLLRVIKWNEVEPVLYMMHKHLTVGHLGTDAIYYKIAEQYYWNQMYQDIQEYVKTCETC